MSSGVTRIDTLPRRLPADGGARVLRRAVPGKHPGGPQGAPCRPLACLASRRAVAQPGHELAARPGVVVIDPAPFCRARIGWLEGFVRVLAQGFPRTAAARDPPALHRAAA